MPTLFVADAGGLATPGEVLTFTGAITVPDEAIGSHFNTFDSGQDMLDGSRIVSAQFTNQGTTIRFSDGTIMNDATRLAGNSSDVNGNVGVYNLADGRTLVSFGNADAYGTGYWGFSDDISRYLTANPGVTVTGITVSTSGNFVTTGDDMTWFAGGAQAGYYLADYAPLSTAVCFTRDTMIDTDQGEIAVQDLAVGMMVRTRDNGFQPIRWIGMSPARDRAVRIKAGALGNTRDLVVSPRHRMVLDGWQLKMLFSHDHALVTAQELVNDSTVVMDAMADVEYYHVLFDAHEIIFAEGAATESFHPDQASMGSMDAAARDEIFALFPELKDGAIRAEAAPKLTLTQAAYVSRNLDAFVN